MVLSAAETEAQARRWRETAQVTRDTARHLRELSDYRSCASRAYYAAYQMATAVCVAYGDAAQFPQGWNNPSHDQLPELIKNNGSLSYTTRRRILQGLRLLRDSREIADYKVGKTVDVVTARNCVLTIEIVLQLLGG